VSRHEELDRKIFALSGIIALGAIIACAQAFAAAPVADISFDLVTSRDWGYNTGLKQTEGAHRNGLSVHAVSRFVRDAPKPSKPKLGSPDSLVWFDETTGQGGAVEHPAGQFGESANPGGNIVFGPGNRLWWVMSGRANALPLDILRSDAPMNPQSFSVVLDDFETYQLSTAPTISTAGSAAQVVYRYDNSGSNGVQVRHQLYDIASGTPVLSAQTVLGVASEDPVFGTVRVEQVWSHWDRNRLMVTWQWFRRDDLPEGRFRYYGSNPVIYTEDLGVTWKYADGSVATLPLTYANRTAVATPRDSLPLDESTDWHPSDMGFLNGTPWIVLPRETLTIDSTPLDARFYRFKHGTWRERQLSANLASGDPLACDSSPVRVVCAFAERDAPGVLRVRESVDGFVWSDPVDVDSVGADSIGWVSRVRTEKPDGHARFVVGYYDANNGLKARDYQNNLRYVRVRVTE